MTQQELQVLRPPGSTPDKPAQNLAVSFMLQRALLPPSF